MADKQRKGDHRETPGDPMRGEDRDGAVATREKRRSGGRDESDETVKKQKIQDRRVHHIEKSPSLSQASAKQEKARVVPVSKTKMSPIAMKLAVHTDQKEPDIKPSKSLTVANMFNEDSDDDEEEMPPEAKMRMKNVGRSTPTSAGPHSFNKSKEGFSNTGRAWRLKREEEIAKKEHEKRMREIKRLEELEGWDA